MGNRIEPYAQNPTFSAVLKDFIAFALSIEDNYSHHIRAFAAHAKTSEVDSLIGLVREYFAALNAGILSASTIRCRRAALKDRLRRAMASPGYTDRDRAAFEHELKEIERDPALKAPSAGAAGVSRSKVITAEEYVTILEHCRSVRQRLFIEFLYTTGARVSELTGVRPGDCAPQGNAVKVRLRGKGTARVSYKERYVFITRALYKRICETFKGREHLFETAGGKRYSRSYVSNEIAKITSLAIGRTLSAHCLRHSFATMQIKRHGRLKAVSRYLGHSDISITARFYDHDELSPLDVLGVTPPAV